jgi:hypothetical protein
MLLYIFYLVLAMIHPDIPLTTFINCVMAYMGSSWPCVAVNKPHAIRLLYKVRRTPQLSCIQCNEGAQWMSHTVAARLLCPGICR